MPEGEGAGTKTSRRRFIKWSGALAVLAVASAGLGVAAGKLALDSGRRATDTSTQTVTASETPTDLVTTTQIQTSTDEVRSTSILTQSLTRTDASTSTVTLTGTAAHVVTEASTLTQSQGETSNQVDPNAPFSVFWITDTQFLSETNPALFADMTTWIANNWVKYNGKLVIHTGDIIQTGNRQDEWENADKAMSVFLQNGIPYTWCAGNHDDLSGGDPATGWIGNKYAAACDPIFVSQQINSLGYTSWVGDYHDGMNTALSFTSNGLNFLVINLEWDAQPDVISWANGILDDPAYKNYHTILGAHAYINAFGFALDSSNYRDLTGFVDGVISMLDSHPNVFLTLNGHYATECGYNTPAPVNSRNQLMFDRQDCTDDPSVPSGRGVDSTATVPDTQRVGGSTVTILTFDTLNNKVGVRTFDVNTGSWRTDSYEQYSFTMFPTVTTTTTRG